MQKSVTYEIGDTITRFIDYIEAGKEEKKVYEDKIEHNNEDDLHIFIEYLDSDKFIYNFLGCAKTFIKSERIDNRDYYVIISNDSGYSSGDYAKIYVDKETALPIKVLEPIGEEESVTYITYEFETVTDEDFKFPDNASEYIKE